MINDNSRELVINKIKKQYFNLDNQNINSILESQYWFSLIKYNDINSSFTSRGYYCIKNKNFLNRFKLIFIYLLFFIM